MIGVFHFGFGQSGFAFGAPVDRFLPFIDIAFLSHFAEDADLYGFVFGL